LEKQPMRLTKQLKDLEGEDLDGFRGEDEERVVYSILDVEEVKIGVVEHSLHSTYNFRSGWHYVLRADAHLFESMKANRERIHSNVDLSVRRLLSTCT
jgi:hypothetical protein